MFSGTFTVAGLEKSPSETYAKITLHAKIEGSGYTSQIFLYVPEKEIGRFALGQRMELRSLIPEVVTGGH